MGKVEYEFHHSNGFGKGHSVHVGVTTNCYGKSLSFINELAHKLRTSIPFPYNEESEPGVVVLGGNRKKGMISVEMGITFAITEAEARKCFEAAGWFSDMEPTAA
jgi:hypothetical protein